MATRTQCPLQPLTRLLRLLRTPLCLVRQLKSVTVTSPGLTVHDDSREGAHLFQAHSKAMLKPRPSNE